MNTTATAAPESSGLQGLLRLASRFQGYVGLLVVVAFGAILSPSRHGVNLFLDPPNQAIILRDVAENGIIAVGMTLVLIVGEIDLSVGSVLALVGTGAAWLLVQPHWGAAATVITALLAGAGVGATNGFVTTRLRIPSFVVTMAMLSFARGLARICFGGIAIPVLPVPGLAPESLFVLARRVAGLPVPALLLLVVAVAIGLVLRYTAFGRHVYACGGNPLAARLSGVAVDDTKVAVFAICGLLVALAAIIHVVQLSQGSPNDGVSYELNAIAAAVIGGTSLTGGTGKVAGTVAGAWMLGMIDNILGLNNIAPDVQLLIKGLLIIAAVALQRLQPRS
ncbi:MAG TPA: ABC transporter permease [Anaeromyxobacter sp.]|nr:ABC transporter permease [Anaeromyxobacter sp.]